MIEPVFVTYVGIDNTPKGAEAICFVEVGGRRLSMMFTGRTPQIAREAAREFMRSGGAEKPAKKATKRKEKA